MKLPRKGTWQMTATQLAKVWADHFGYKGRDGGWIYSPDNVPVAHGWLGLAALLQQRRLIVVGQGVNWRASGQRPRFSSTARSGR